MSSRALAAAKLSMGLVALGVVQISHEVHAQNWAERLGFPEGRKVVLLHGREIGMCHEANAAAAQLLDAGLLRSVSVMAPCPWFADAVELSRSHADADVGLELTLNSEFDRYRWQSVAPDDLVGSLRDADGFLWQTPIQTMVNASADEVELELVAQIDRARQSGLNPTHLTTHLGALTTRPDLIEIYLRTARRRWIPAVVVELTAEHVARFEKQGYPLPDDIIELLADYPLPKVDDLRMSPDGETYEQKKEAFLKMLDELSLGITQVSLRPAVESQALKRITPDWQQRVWDAQLLLDADVAAAINERQIIVTDWRELMDRFQGGAEAATAESDSVPAGADRGE